MLRKLILFFKIYSKCKINFKIPKKNILIFDKEGLPELEQNVLKNQDYFILENRPKHLSKLFFTHNLILNILKDLHKLFGQNTLKIQDLYLLSLIKIINPKIIMTFIDNSDQFSRIAKNVDHDVKIIAIQGSMRHVWDFSEYMFKKKIIKKNLNEGLFIPNYLCFGKFEIDKCKKFKIKVGKFKPIGSLRLSNFLIERENNNYIKKFDICLLSDIGAWDDMFENKRLDVFDQAQKGFLKLIKWTIKYTMYKNLKFVFAFKSRKNSKASARELAFYKSNLSQDEFNYITTYASMSSESQRYNSYYSAYGSELTIAKTSTMLREMLACENKILACNLTGIDLFNFPVGGICNLKNCDYNQFSKRISEILEIKDDKYLSKISSRKNDMIFQSNPKEVIKAIKNELIW